eukprot:TRINITY_DN41587_c0_g1_i2.p1 TRINITY_DN41587_c0_g1~~TRINITY_DN41587_c0_g1_i2.p1  ORF type:complete len:469 (-),score=68.12 TRINITY_DN41587_c0_g1_i2:233-1639(-)
MYRQVIPGPNDFQELVDAAAEGVFLELDYHHEAANAKSFGELHRFLGFVDVPRWVPEYTGPVGTSRVLTTEFVVGKRISDLPVAKGREAVQKLVQACVVQLLITGFVHADPHEGNLLYTEDGRLVFLDFGLMDRIAPKVMEGFADGIQGVVAGDWRRVAHSMQTVEFTSTPVKILEDANARELRYVDTDFDQFVLALEEQMTAEEGGQSRFSAMASGLEKLSWTYLMLTPPYIVLLTRTFMTLEGIAEKVDPTFNIYTAALPVAVRRALTPQTRQARQAMRDTILTPEGSVRWTALEDMLKDAPGAEDGTDGGEEGEATFDSFEGLLTSPEGVALRRILYDAQLTNAVQYLASHQARPWRRSAARWLSDRTRAGKSKAQGKVSRHRSTQAEARHKRLLRLIAKKQWDRLYSSQGLLGTLSVLLLFGSVASKVALRSVWFSCLGAAGPLRGRLLRRLSSKFRRRMLSKP